MNTCKGLKRLFAVVAALTCALGIPGLASAVNISVDGNLDTAFRLFGPDSPFSVGDPVAGSFDVDLGAGNAFDVGTAVDNPVGSLSNFNITVGPATFDLGTSDFAEFSGNLSDDGSTLERLAFDSFPMDVGLDVPYGLQVQGPPDLIYVTNSGIIHAPITTTVSQSATAVPEPGSLAMLGFTLALIGLGAAAGRRRKI